MTVLLVNHDQNNLNKDNVTNLSQKIKQMITFYNDKKLTSFKENTTLVCNTV